MDKIKSKISQIFCVEIEDLEFEFKIGMFFLFNTFTILGICFLLNLNLLNALLIIVFSNRLFDRQSGYHASSLLNCYITSVPFYVLCTYLSDIYILNPIVILILCCVILYDEIESTLIFVLGSILTISILDSNYLYLSNCLFYSMIYAYISSNKYTVGLMTKLDNVLSKIKILK